MKSDALTRRIQAILLLAMVLSVPALTRATQHLSCTASGHETSGFSTSADSAPERIVLSPGLRVVANASCVVDAPVMTIRLAPRIDERLPPPPLIAAARPLRAPPAPAACV
jgi:hypothetical protein